MYKAPIIENLINYLNTNPLSLHTPGHKGGQIIPPLLKASWPENIWPYDVTETFGMDNLHYPAGCIKEAQQMTAQLFNAKDSHFLVNGTSVGIQAAILALAYNKQIFVARNVHKSIYNGMVLANAKPVYLPITMDDSLGFPLGIEPDVLKEHIRNYPQCKTLLITHPSYQGVSYKLKELIELALANGLEIIVDEAHGSHLAFHDALPPTALSLGAHIVVQSWHKTLPVLTQASVLHVGHGYKGPELSQYLNLLQTTSPSYLLLASLDGCRQFLATGIKDIMDATVNKINILREEISSLKNIQVYQSQGASKLDLLKLCLNSSKISGYQLAEFLRMKYNIYVELAEEGYCLLIFGINSDPQIFQRIFEALNYLDQKIENHPQKIKPLTIEPLLIPKTKLLLREAFFQEIEKVKIDEAQGRIAGSFVLKYPPGVPLLVPGELIDRDIWEMLKKNSFQYKIEDGILVIKEKEEILNGG